METRYTDTRAETPRMENGQSLVALVRELRDETTTLVRQEVALAKAELSEKTSKITQNVTSLAIGGVMALGAFGLLLLALQHLLAVGLLSAGLSAATVVWLSPLIVAVVVGIIGAAMIMKGKKALSKEGLAPEKTMETLRDDKDWAKNRIQKAS